VGGAEMTPEEAIKRLKHILSRLYSERKWEIDEMRDTAQHLDPAVELAVEALKEWC
jgi:hypothetical protein